MLTLTDVKAKASTGRRVMIKPVATVKVTNNEQKRQVNEVAKRVMKVHYDVLLALKNR
ncbi:hypothetical protein [Comamonas testosteroni]|uniref:hypothetical protein n=1 Tax=Comamonas testosteroni TaxID=285 RepID=UPI000AACB97C|nr:hypothetical protein [Comamonas testosteroni]